MTIPLTTAQRRAIVANPFALPSFITPEIEAEARAADLAIHFGISTRSMLKRLGAMHARGLVVKSGDRNRGVFWRAAE